MTYYSEHIEEYIESTIEADMSETYALFERYLPEGASILDVGFGSARDMLYFKGKGYIVKGIDVEQGFVDHARKLGLEAEIGDVRSYETAERFDGIWACASLLHLQSGELNPAIEKLLSFLKPSGILLISMKEGEGEYQDEKGRHMLLANEATFKKYNVQEITHTVEKGRGVSWVNAIIKAN